MWRGRLWRFSRRSGVTPGTNVSCSFRRVRRSALDAHHSSRRTRRVGAPTAVSHGIISRFVDLDGLADAFLAGPWDLNDLVKRAGLVLGKRYRWIRPLARRVLAEFGDRRRTRSARLGAFLSDDTGFQRAFERHDLAPFRAMGQAGDGSRFRRAGVVEGPGRSPRPPSWRVCSDLEPEAARLVRRHPGPRTDHAGSSRCGITAIAG